MKQINFYCIVIRHKHNDSFFQYVSKFNFDVSPLMVNGSHAYERARIFQSRSEALQFLSDKVLPFLNGSDSLYAVVYSLPVPMPF